MLACGLEPLTLASEVCFCALQLAAVFTRLIAIVGVVFSPGVTWLGQGFALLATLLIVLHHCNVFPEVSGIKTAVWVCLGPLGPPSFTSRGPAILGVLLQGHSPEGFAWEGFSPAFAYTIVNAVAYILVDAKLPPLYTVHSVK
jgi:hypothetical protein